MNLKNNDYKLLEYLYHNQREPITKIAKQSGLTRKQVEYMIQKYHKKGIIKKTLTMFDLGSFGYSKYVFLLVKLNEFSSLENFTRELGKDKHCMSWGQCHGGYDIYMNLIFQNDEQLSDYLGNLVSSKKAKVSDYRLIDPFLAEFHPAKIHEGKNSKLLSLKFEDKKRKFTKSDLALFRNLQKNGDSSIVDLAVKSKISAELALYKLKKFTKEKVILGTRLHLNMQKLGYNFSGIFLHINNLSKKTRNKLLKFSRDHKLVNALLLSLSKPNCFIQVFHKNEDELRNVIKEFKLLLKKELVQLELLLLEEEKNVNTLPFV